MEKMNLVHFFGGGEKEFVLLYCGVNFKKVSGDLCCEKINNFLGF
jgi:hypothetical protein